MRRHPYAQRFPRALTLAERPTAAREIPILGRIAAGLPLQSEENREGTLPAAQRDRTRQFTALLHQP